jgi:hypothetical protein
MGTEILTKARMTVIDGDGGKHRRRLANHSDRRITSTRIYPLIDLLHHHRGRDRRWWTFSVVLRE